MPFVTLASLPAKNIFPGIAGHYTHTEKLTLGEVELAAAVVLPTHQHLHDQISCVLAGRMEFTIGAETRLLEAGMSAVIPGGAPHGARTLTACRVLDIFSPPRDDYR